MANESSLLCLFAMQFLLLFSAEKVRAKVSAIIVFGDSTVDADNNNLRLIMSKSNYKPYGQDFEGGKPTGRWTNGRLFTDFISGALGIKFLIPDYLDPDFGIEDFETGVTFASGGAGYDNLTTTIVASIPLWKKLEFFKEYKEKLTKFQGEEKATKTIREALYIVSIGTNDFIENYLTIPIRSLQFNMEEFQNFLTKNTGRFIKDLRNLGARKISLSGSFPMGCLPIVRTLNVLVGRACLDRYNEVARDFNRNLINLVADLNKEVSGIRVVYADAYSLVIQMIETPSLYGFEVVKNGCCGTGTVEVNQLCMLAVSICKDPTKYIYWDAIHFTEKANGLYADNLMKTGLAELL
ncbi:hypothetical protein MKX03_023233 [Papaver bracteatum]|nr:hypothetical protein MKX03_023233 [Papaver bracteatum]